MSAVLCLLLVAAIVHTEVTAGILPSNDELRDKLANATATEKGNILTNTFSKAKDYIEDKINGSAPTDVDDEPIDAKYFDDIGRIIRHLDFEKATPRAVDKKEVTYFLFTRPVGSNYSRVDSSNPEALNIKRKNIVFLVHGWTGSREKKWYQQLTDAILEQNDVAVVQVDWRSPAGDLYSLATYNVIDVGAIVGELILKIHNDYGVDLDKINIVGHSLGAHVAGFAGKFVRNATNEKIAKIFALDPAGPLFKGRAPEKRLSKDDARSVVVLHTDGGVFGNSDVLGTVDFYPNGGTGVQPGCLDLGKLTLKTITSPIFCSHQRAYKYFIDAMKTPPGFLGIACESYGDFKKGRCAKNKKFEFLTDDLNTRGTFYFKTNSDSPFRNVPEEDE